MAFAEITYEVWKMRNTKVYSTKNNDTSTEKKIIEIIVNRTWVKQKGIKRIG